MARRPGWGVYLINVEGPKQGNGRPVDWADLVAGIRADDEEAVFRLGDIFRGGIHFFLRQGLGQHKLKSRQREVLSLVIKNIRETSIDDPNRLASYVLTVLREYIGSQITACPHLVAEGESRPVGQLVAVIASADENIDALIGDAGGASAPAPASAAPSPAPPASARGTGRSGRCRPDSTRWSWPPACA